MSLPVAVAAALFAGILIYALFGGADFGTGYFDLTAGNARDGAALRTQIDHSIGPVWEANHVWLIYILVVWWTGFPQAFAATMTTLAVPFLFALLGIVLRGAAFVFRKYAETLRQAQTFGAAFAAASLITPFFLGAAVGGIASGRVPAQGHGDLWTSWINPTSLVGGLVAAGTCAFLAGTFLTADAHRSDDSQTAAALRRQSLAVGVATGAIVCAGPFLIASDAPTLWAGLTGTALPLILISTASGTVTLALLWARKYKTARLTAVLAVAAVISGWGIGQYPWMLVDQMSIHDAAGAPATLVGLLVVVGLAVVLVLPAFAYLLMLSQSEPSAKRA